MSFRTWNGGTGVFENKDDWTDGIAPVFGDTIAVTSGTVLLNRSNQPQPGSYDGLDIALGSTTGRPAELQLDGATLGAHVAITSDASTTFATLTSIGTSGFQGSIDASASGGAFTIQATTTDTSQPADFVLLQGSEVSISGGDRLVENGRLDNHGTIDIGLGDNLTVNGTLDTVAGTLKVAAYASVTGGGTLGIGLGGELYIVNPTAAAINISFDGPGGLLHLGVERAFDFHVTNYQAGDLIEFNNNAFNDQAVDYADFEGGLLTLRSGGSQGAVVEQLDVQGPAASGAIPVISAGLFQPLFIGTSTATADTASDLLAPLTSAAADHALHSDIVRATDRTAAGAPIDGTGVRIGIVSDSFNTHGGGRPDQEAIAGYLPLAADGKTNAVVVLNDSANGSGKDEGRAMAEIIHRIAPGAQLYFYSGIGADALASGVAALADAGCNVIVDDLYVRSASGAIGEPFYQVAGAVDRAIEAAVARGIDYFAAAGNVGDQSFQGIFSANHASTTLHDGTTVDAFVFGDGTPYQTIRGVGVGRLDLSLQWDAPVSTATTLPAQELAIKVFDASGHLVATSKPTQAAGGGAGKLLTLPGQDVGFNVAAGATYQIAIYNPGGPVAGTFAYVLTDGGVGQTAAEAVIVDPAAEQGAGTIYGHALLPDVNAVAAANYANTPAYSDPLGFVDSYSSTGPGTLLFDPSGKRLATPQTVNKPDFTASVGESTAVPGFQPFTGTSAAAPAAAAVAALLLQSQPTLSTAQVTAILKASAVSLNEPARLEGAGLIQADTAVALANQVACYASGTAILTPAGERAVETLDIGMTVVTGDGTHRPIRWIGRRAYSGRFLARNPTIRPVLFRAGALGAGVPRRDLRVSPKHAMFISGVLVPAELLVNDMNIVHDSTCTAVEYYHVELCRHAVIFAEGAPSETFVDDDSRLMFHNASQFHAMYPDEFRAPARYCAPRVEDGFELEAIRRQLAIIAGQDRMAA